MAAIALRSTGIARAACPEPSSAWPSVSSCDADVRVAALSGGGALACRGAAGACADSVALAGGVAAAPLAGDWGGCASVRLACARR